MNRIFFKSKVLLNISTFTLLLLFWVACGRQEEEKKQDISESSTEVIASVDDEKLYKADILGLIPAKTKKEDSLKLIDEYVQSWIRTKLILNKAQDTEGISVNDIEEKVQNYRNSLLAFELEKKYLETKLDTSVKESAIKEYYQKYESNFVLQQPILKLYYLKVPLIAPDIDTLPLLIQNVDEDILKRLKSYSQRNADAYHLNSNEWKYWDNIVEDLGALVSENRERLLQKDALIEERTQTHLYLVKVLDVQSSTQKAPLEFVRERIKNLILNQRKATLIKEFEKNIYEEAKKKNKFKIYYK